MSFETGAIISVELKQQFLGKEVVNKLFYRIVLVAAEIVLEAALEAVSQILVSAITPVQSENLTHVEQIWLDESDGVGIVRTNITETGDVLASQDLPTSNAFGATKAVLSRLTRPGGIRIGGVTEASTDGNTITVATANSLVNVGTAIASPINTDDGLGGNMTLQPVVVGRNIDGSLNLTKVQDVTTVGNWRLTTQVSRR